MTPRDPHQDAGVPRPRPGHGSLPRPSRADAVAASDMEELRPGPAAAGESLPRRSASGRRDPEEGAHHHRRDEPHLTANDRDAPLQGEHEGRERIPALPANASGRDRVSTDEQPDAVDEESMYENRPEEDKNWSPP